MVISGELKFKSAIIITPDSIHEFESLLLNYCEEVAYTATLQNSNKIFFENIEELLAYSNIGKSKIVKLKISGKIDYNPNAIVIVFSKQIGFITAYQETIDIEYSFDNENDVVLFTDKCKKIHQKIKASYTIPSKLSGTLFWFIFVAILFMVIFYNALNDKTTNEGHMAPIYFLLIFVVSFGGLVVAHKLFNAARDYLLPPLLFLWGEEISRNIRISSLRKNIFWVIFIGILVSIISAILVSTLTK